jgi:NADH:ubiquinone oxidoreductase subunit F (NADH-binding)
MEGILFPRGIPETPEDLEQYRRRGGYQALGQALKNPPDAVIEVISAAGLRGRGGAGFPTGKKWQLTRESPGETRYLVLNGGEDEPGSKKDRVLLEHVPHLVLEGVILGAYAIGAAKAYLYINTRYDTASARISQALVEAKASGVWGMNVLGSGFLPSMTSSTAVSSPAT